MRLTQQNVSRLTSYFIGKLRVKPWNTGWLRQGMCPHCGKEQKFGINIWTDRTNCFSCGYHPKPLMLLMKLENLETFVEAYRFLEAFDGVEYLEMRMPQLDEKEVKLPESFSLLSLGNTTTGRLARNYMADRGYDIDYLTMKGIGYCTKGDYAFRIIIPYYAKGKLIYFNARAFIQKGRKHKNPPLEEFGIGKSQLIYNIDALYNYDRIYMVESATNALTLGDDAIAFGGKMVSEYQLSNIIKSPCKRLIMLWDPDAIWDALRLALKIAPYKRIKVVEMPMEYEGKEKPDVNDLGKRTSLSIAKQFEYENYQELYKRYIRTPRPFHHLPIA